MKGVGYVVKYAYSHVIIRVSTITGCSAGPFADAHTASVGCRSAQGAALTPQVHRCALRSPQQEPGTRPSLPPLICLTCQYANQHQDGPRPHSVKNAHLYYVCTRNFNFAMRASLATARRLPRRTTLCRNHTYRHGFIRPLSSGPSPPSRLAIPGVRRILAVASGKGGVGKSTFSGAWAEPRVRAEPAVHRSQPGAFSCGAGITGGPARCRCVRPVHPQADPLTMAVASSTPNSKYDPNPRVAMSLCASLCVD